MRSRRCRDWIGSLPTVKSIGLRRRNARLGHELTLKKGSDVSFVVFFFQAEDGIRDLIVTGVQTCALPILSIASPSRTILLRGFVCSHDGRFASAWLAVSLVLRSFLPGRRRASRSRSLTSWCCSPGAFTRATGSITRRAWW